MFSNPQVSLFIISLTRKPKFLRPPVPSCTYITTSITFRIKWQERKIMVIPLTLPGKQGPHFLFPLARDTVFSQVLDACTAMAVQPRNRAGLGAQGPLLPVLWQDIYMASPRPFDAYTCYSVKGSKL